MTSVLHSFSHSDGSQLLCCEQPCGEADEGNLCTAVCKELDCPLLKPSDKVTAPADNLTVKGFEAEVLANLHPDS